MALNYLRITSGIQLIPKVSDANSIQGELDVSSTDGNLYFHDGTASVPVLTTTNSVTVINKSFDGNNNTFTNVPTGAFVGVLPLTSGGTGVNAASPNAAYNALSPMTTTGDLEYESAPGIASRLPIGSSTQVLTVVAGIPAWANVPAGFTNPMTSVGDMIIGGVSGAATRLAASTNGFVLSLVSGSPAWVAAPATGANTSLSNLSSVAINTSLLPAVTQTISLGSSGNQFAALFAQVSAYYNGSGTEVLAVTGTTTNTPSLTSVASAVQAQSGFNLGIYTASNSSGSSAINIETGNATSGNSGNIVIQTGTASGTRGSLLINSPSSFNTGPSIAQITTPSSPSSGFNKIYPKSDNNFYSLNSSGSEVLISTPMTTGGDIVYGGTAGAPTRLGNGINGQVLTSSGGTAAPQWTTSSASPFFTSYSMVITATTTSPTFGTLPLNTANFMKIGKIMFVRFDFQQTSAGTDGSGTYLFSIPAGTTIDTSIIPAAGSNFVSSMIGTASESGGSANRIGGVRVYDSTHLALAFGDQVVPYTDFNTSNYTFFALSSCQLSFTCSVPIV